MSIQVVPYVPAEHEEQWDRFCATSLQPNLLHTRRFLSYHGDRFRDRSVLLLRNGKLAGLLPAAEVPGQPVVVGSHPGATFGGVVHDGRLAGARMIDAMQAMQEHYGQLGYGQLVYKPLPLIYAAAPAQDDLYALFRLGASRIRCDLSCGIDLRQRGVPSERRRRALKKAQPRVQVGSDPGQLAVAWQVVADTLSREHGARPVHTLEELSQLRSLFPHEIVPWVATEGGAPVAAVIVFRSPRVWRAQYIGASEEGYAVCALDAVFDRLIAEAAAAGAQYFDFGTSNEDGGRVLNEGLYTFKSEFGGGGVAYEHYAMDLR